MRSNKRSLLREYGNQTTIHGVHYLIEGNPYSKLFWTATMLLCSIILLYNCSVIAIDFMESPKVTNVRTSYVREFPSLMYCPMGTVTTAEVVERHNLRGLDIVFLNDYFMGPRTYGLDWIDETSMAILNAKNSLRLRKLSMNVAEYLKHISSFVEISADFDNRTGYYESMKLNYVLNVTYYGICFKLVNSAIARQGQFPTLLTIKLPSFRQAMPKELDLHYSYGMLFMGNNVESFQPKMPIFVKDGRENYIEMKETRIESKSSARQPCMSEKGYIAASRVYDCFDRTTSTIANCSYLRSLDTNLSTEQLCHQMINNDGLTKSYHLGFSECVDSHVGRHMSCSQVMFEATVTDVTAIKANTTLMFIQYRFAMILQIEEQDMYTWQRFLSNIGGLISLLCGASVISLAQMLYFLARALTSFRRKTRQAGQIRRKPKLKNESSRAIASRNPSSDQVLRQSSNCMSPNPRYYDQQIPLKIPPKLDFQCPTYEDGCTVRSRYESCSAFSRCYSGTRPYVDNSTPTTRL